MLICDAAQAVPVPDNVSLEKAAFAEPLAVCLHAVARAGSLLGQRLLIIGAGPIGVLTALAARRAGAEEIVVTDVVDAPLAIAKTCGADRTINVAAEPDALTAYEADKGSFDVMFEAAGRGETLIAGLKVVRPLGILVQIGQGAEATLPMSLIVTQELDLRGTFRFTALSVTAPTTNAIFGHSVGDLEEHGRVLAAIQSRNAEAAAVQMERMLAEVLDAVSKADSGRQSRRKAPPGTRLRTTGE